MNHCTSLDFNHTKPRLPPSVLSHHHRLRWIRPVRGAHGVDATNLSEAPRETKVGRLFPVKKTWWNHGETMVMLLPSIAGVSLLYRIGWLGNANSSASTAASQRGRLRPPGLEEIASCRLKACHCNVCLLALQGYKVKRGPHVEKKRFLWSVNC